MALSRRRSVVLLATLVAAYTGARAQDATGEYRLKAAFVYRFPQFVDWPDEAWRGARAVQLCVLQPNDFGSALDELTRGESLNGRPLVVRQIGHAAELDGCHLAFAGARSDATGLLKAASTRPILTVGETDAFLRDGGVILLRVVNRRVRFEISAANARRAGLRISSQLLALATSVHGGTS
jgi:hypothetical protein